MSEKTLIQRVIIEPADVRIYCPFCGAKVDPLAFESKIAESVCSHTLFIATSEGGFEYRSKRFDSLVNITDETADFGGEDGVDVYTDKLEVANAVKFALYDPMPSGMGAFFGFAL